MLTNEQAFEQAIKHFPSWLDIRKRKNKSLGGLYLRSITDETSGINEALETYRQEFFAYHYVDKEDSVLDYVLSATVGELDAAKLTLIQPEREVVVSAEIFNRNKENLAYYEDGKLLLSYDESIEQIEYELDGDRYTARAESIHLWNVFDEFALYTGLKRHEGERNKALLNRCLLAYKNVTNSSEAGLKNAIMNELSQTQAIRPVDIVIEKVNETNIHAEDATGISVSEHIVQEDADVYRAKVWNRNNWDHSFKQLKFASHKWNELIKNAQIGTGQNTNLESLIVEQIKDNLSTDATVSVYKKSKHKVDEYLKENQKEIEIPLVLKKYNNELSPLEVEYKITAEEIVEITNESIFVEAYKNNSGSMSVPLEEIVIDRFDKEYDVIQNGALAQGRYKLRFTSSKNYGRMDIRKAELTEGKAKTNLLKESGSFTFDETTLKTSASKFYSNRKEDFFASENIINSPRGLQLGDTAHKGQVELDVSDIENQYVRYEVMSRMSDIIENPKYITNHGFVMSNGKWIGEDRNGSIVIEGRMTELQYAIEKGNVGIYTTIDGETNFALSNGQKIFDIKLDEAKDIRVEIQKIEGTGDVVIKHIRYAHYEISVNIDAGELIRTPQGIVIPKGEGKRHLFIEMQSFTGLSPVMDYVYIGSSLANVSYETEEFVLIGQGRLDIDTDCVVELIDLNAQTSTNNFTTNTSYANNSSEKMYVEISLESFGVVESSTPAIEPISYKGRNGYYVALLPGENISHIAVQGERSKKMSQKNLLNLLKTDASSEVFVSKILKGFIVRDGANEQLKRITKDDINSNANLIKIVGLKESLQASFVTDEINNKEVIAGSYSNFDYMYVFPKETKQYVAYNKEMILKSRTDDIDIIDVFHPKIPVNSLVVYHIEVDRNLKGISVLFKQKHWHVGREKISIIAELGAMKDQFSKETISLKNKFIVSDYMYLEENLVPGQSLGAFIIEVPAGHEIHFVEELSDYEHFYAKNDGFNKLAMSNIVEIESIRTAAGATVDEKYYTLLKDEGIIYWRTNLYDGEVIEVIYRYNIPSYVRITDIDILYTLLSYEVSAMELMYEIVYHGITESKMLLKEDRESIAAGDFLVVKSTNPLVKIEVKNESLMLEKLHEKYKTNHVFVKPGFYYVDQLEWYKYANPETKELGGSEGIELIDTERLNDEILFSQESSNFIRNSNMLSKDLRTILEVDFDQLQMAKDNTIEKLTSADMYHKWKAFDTNLSFKQGHNGKGLHFAPLSKHAYVLLDISEYTGKDVRVSAYAESTLRVYVARQRVEHHLSVIHCEEIIPMTRADNFVYYEFEQSEKAALLVVGHGVIDDILCTSKDLPLSDVHTKNIDKLGFVFNETEQPQNQFLLFDENHNKTEQAEIDEEGIRTSTSLNWGMTKLFDYKNDWNASTKSRILVRKDSYLETENANGIIYLPVKKIERRQNVKSIFIRINNVLLEQLKGFDMTVLTGRTEDGEFSVVETIKNSNSVTINGARLSDYIKLVITMPKEKIIEDIEVYAEYAEGQGLSVRHYSRGYLETKIYDIGSPGNYFLSAINLQNQELFGRSEVLVRALRQNETDIVYTDWQKVELDATGHVTNRVQFENYEYFQFRIEMNREADRVQIESFELGVTE